MPRPKRYPRSSSRTHGESPMAAPTAIPNASSQVRAGLEGVVATETKLSMVDGQNGRADHRRLSDRGVRGKGFHRGGRDAAVDAATCRPRKRRRGSRRSSPAIARCGPRRSRSSRPRATRRRSTRCAWRARRCPSTCRTRATSRRPETSRWPSACSRASRPVVAAHARLRQGLDPIPPRAGPAASPRTSFI